MRKFLFIWILFLSILINAQDVVKISKPYLPEENTSFVFVPKTSQSNSTHPLLFLLHGYSGSHSDWNNNISVQKLADEYGFIIVCPDGYYNGWYVNSPKKQNSKYEKFFWKDLVSHITKNYKVDKNNIFITGLSMGGHGAMNLYLKNQNFFKAGGSMSGILDIRLFTEKWEIKDLLGDYKNNHIDWDNNSAIVNLKKYKTPNTKIIVDCGTEDFAYQSNVNFLNEAKSFNVDIKFNERKGNHDWHFWTESIINHLKYFKSLVK